MNSNEAAICSRLKQFRKWIDWPQTVTANEVGITKDRLASIEYARTPLRYGLALRFAERYDINLRWLATGAGSPQSHWKVRDKVQASIPPKMLFSRAYTLFLEPEISPDLLEFLNIDERTGAKQIVIPPTDVSSDSPHKWFILDALRDAFNRLPKSARSALCDHVLAAINSICEEHGVKGFTYSATLAVSQGKRGEKQGLAVKSPQNELAQTLQSGRIGGVKTDWHSLRERLNRLTQKRGMKTKLAKRLKLKLSSLSLWLSGEREPGVEVGFRLLAWCEEQERKS